MARPEGAGAEGPVRIFISRKDEDEAIAEDLARLLELLGGSGLQAIDASQIPPGDDWFDWIEDELTQADLLILLFTDATASWDWCLYEVGLYTPLGEPAKRPVVCIHTRTEGPPAPLKHLQAIRAEAKEVRRLLVRLFGGSEITGREPPLNPGLVNDDAELDRATERVCRALNPAVTKVYNRFVDLTFDRNENIFDDLREAVVGADPISLQIFDLQEHPIGEPHWTWADLVEQFDHAGADAEWIEEVEESISVALLGPNLRPMRNLVRSLGSEKVYRPNVHSLHFHTSGAVTTRILFVHQPQDEGPNEMLPSLQRSLVTERLSVEFDGEGFEMEGLDIDVDVAADINITLEFVNRSGEEAALYVVRIQADHTWRELTEYLETPEALRVEPPWITHHILKGLVAGPGEAVRDHIGVTKGLHGIVCGVPSGSPTRLLPVASMRVPGGWG